MIQTDVASSLREKFTTLFPTWPTIVATIVALLIIIIILTKLVYKPIKKMNTDRRNYIQSNIDEAVKQNKAASIDREHANEELIMAHNQAFEIISEAKVVAEEVKTHKITKTQKQIQILLNGAKKDIEAQQHKFNQESREAIIEVALAAAAKVVEKEVNNKTNQKIIKDFIEANK